MYWRPSTPRGGVGGTASGRSCWSRSRAQSQRLKVTLSRHAPTVLRQVCRRSCPVRRGGRNRTREGAVPRSLCQGRLREETSYGVCSYAVRQVLHTLVSIKHEKGTSRGAVGLVDGVWTCFDVWNNGQGRARANTSTGMKQRGLTSILCVLAAGFELTVDLRTCCWF